MAANLSEFQASPQESVWVKCIYHGKVICEYNLFVSVLIWVINDDQKHKNKIDPSSIT